MRLARLTAATSAGLLVVLTAGVANAQAAAAPCSAAYEATTPPALELVGIQPKVAYGRRMDLRVEENGASRAGYARDGEATPATLTMQSSTDASPYSDTKSNILGEDYFLEPERREGSGSTVQLAYDETLYGASPETCRRTLVKHVLFVTGRRPGIVASTSGGLITFAVRTFGPNCSLTQTGRLTLTIYAPDRVGHLSVSDVCNGRWSREVVGAGWSLFGGAVPSPDSGTEAYLSADTTTPGIQHYALVFSFRGHPYLRSAVKVTVH
jgi:hypothetical protein